MNVSHLKCCGVLDRVNNLAAPLDVLEKPEFTDYRGVGMVPTTVFTCCAISYNTRVLGMRSAVEGKTRRCWVMWDKKTAIFGSSKTFSYVAALTPEHQEHPECDRRLIGESLIVKPLIQNKNRDKRSHIRSYIKV